MEEQTERPEHAEYLRTPEWRRVRDAAIYRVGHRCQRCGQRGQLQVHHRTYERLGHEREDDLEVLCERHHREHHLAEFEESSDRIYLALARQALNANPGCTIADLSEETKLLCVKHHVPYNGPTIHKAIRLMGLAKVAPITAAVLTNPDSPEAKALTAEMTHEVLDRLGIETGNVLRQLPDGFLPHDRELLDQVRKIRAETLAAGEARSWEEYVERVFMKPNPLHGYEAGRVASELQEMKDYVRWYGA